MAWTEERIDLVQSIVALCDKGLADVAVHADGENGDTLRCSCAGVPGPAVIGGPLW